MPKSTYQIEREQRMAKQAKAMKSLTEDQIKAIDTTFNTLKRSLTLIHEINDLYMSDIRAMEDAYWKICQAFNKENNNA